MDSHSNKHRQPKKAIVEEYVFSSSENDDNESADDSDIPSLTPAKKQRRMLDVKKTMTSFSKDGGRKTKKTISHSFNNHHDNYNAIRAVTPAVRGAELMQSVTLPKMSKDEMPELCLMKIVSIDEIELNNKKQQQQQQESAVCMVLKPLVAEGIDGTAIYHNDKPTRNEEGILEYQEFISYTGEALPEKFTSKAHKKLIQSGARMNAQECYLCIQPTVNRFHPNNMYQKNVSLNYRLYMSADISDILIDMGEEGPFSETNKVHLNILLEEMIAASMKTLISNKAACSRFNKSKNRPVESDMRPMVRNVDKLTRKHFFLASLEPDDHNDHNNNNQLTVAAQQHL